LPVQGEITLGDSDTSEDVSEPEAESEPEEEPDPERSLAVAQQWVAGKTTKDT
jgi:hypothetical protein